MKRDEDSADRDEDRAIEPPLGDPPPDGEGRIDEELLDEELLVLRVPPPSPRQALFIVLILGLSFFMLFWFFSDLRYLLQALGEPRDLGEVADLHPASLRSHSYVRACGIPMTNRTLVFSKGVRWFSDTERKIFPLAGRPELLVEWRVPDEQRAYRDEYSNPERERLPFEFQGRLVPREELRGKYERIWLFYDCLEGYSVRECKLCFGAEGMDQCRRRIACAIEIGEDCRRILSDPGDSRGAAVGRKHDELLLDEARRLHRRLVDLVGERRRAVTELERDLADLASGRMIPRIEEAMADLRHKLEQARTAERDLLRRIREDRGLDADGLKAAAERAAADLELTRVEIRDAVRGAEAARADAGAAETGALEDVADRLAELEARRDELARLTDADRALLEQTRELSRLTRERADAVAELEASLADAGSGAMKQRLEIERQYLESLAALDAGAARLEGIAARLEALAPGSPEVGRVVNELGELRRELGHSSWVLVDGEHPIDSLWVVAVYLIFLLMIASNIRHLYRFWLAWKA